MVDKNESIELDESQKINTKINGIDVNITKTLKYTNVIFNVYFLQNYTPDSEYLQLISELVSKCNNDHPTMEAQCQYLYKLYGSGVFASKFSNYKTVGLKFSIDVLNEKLVDDSNIYDETFNALKSLIYNPHTEIDKNGNTIFNKKDFNEVLNNAINNLLNESNDKRRYSFYRFFKKMTKKDEFPLSIKQSLSGLKKIKSIDLYNYYQNILHNSKVIICAIGDVTTETVKKFIDTVGFVNNDIELEFEDKFINTDIKPVRFTEKADILQSHIYMGYRTDIDYHHDLYPSYILFNIMFGELPSSTLFSKIREEQGLAYTVYSTILPIRNLLYIYAGVDNNKINHTIKSIKKQLLMYKNKTICNKQNRNYYEMLLEASKSELKSEYINALDSQINILGSDLKDSIVKRRSLQKLYEDSLKCTLEDICEASNHLFLDTTYVLRGGSKDE